MLLMAYSMYGLAARAFTYANYDTIEAWLAGDETNHDYSLPRIESYVRGV